MAHVLDLNVKINDGKFSVYDKRKDFAFSIIQFAPSDSNILGVFQSQIIRYFRICSEYESSKERVCNTIIKFIELGFAKGLLRSKFSYLLQKHSFIYKFNNTDDLIMLFD